MEFETVKGFKDFTGEEARKREQIRAILVNSFEQYGFEPAETPVVEYREFVRGENTSDEAVSDIFKLEDKGKRQLALRYELTFQLKRLMQGKKLPYKRYCIGPVFRDEPVTGNRLRQFVQCDIDTIGSTVKEEAEVLAAVSRILNQLNIPFVININNRKLLNEILEKANIEKMDWEKVIKEIDKMDKLDKEEVFNNLRGYGAQQLLDIFSQPESSFEKYSAYAEIKELKEYCKQYGVSVQFSPSLARGLSYYNGSVFEVKTKEMKETITAGGSYIFNNVQSTGISFGLDRLSKIAKVESKEERVMVLSINQDSEAISLAEKLRNEGKNCLLSFDKISKALAYANALGLSKVYLLGAEEVKLGKVKVRDMVSGKEDVIPLNVSKEKTKGEKQ